MKRTLLIALLAVAVAFTATPAFASVQNIKLSGDIQSTFISRSQFDLGTTNSPVTPVTMSSDSLDECANLIIDLRENYNIFVSAVLYPVVPKGTLILRIIPTAVHTQEDIDLTLTAFSAIRDKLKSGEYRVKKAVTA